ncbi:HipA-like C-terminal domain [Butyrivibrio fibrisolvens 16/4]|nr:HipA-like C-terminal domain [Butyrivibrio fibrisolvens 16/4]
MKLAELVGIKTVPNALIKMNNTYAYITKRIDRRGKEMYAMEDFCQLSNRITSDKYKGSYEGCGRVIQKYSKNVGLDETELFYRLVFCFLTGNSDMHLKNFSLIEDSPGSRVFGLSAAYDMLPVNIIMPEDKEQMALTVNGKNETSEKGFSNTCGEPWYYKKSGRTTNITAFENGAKDNKRSKSVIYSYAHAGGIN